MIYDHIIELICDADRATCKPSAAWQRSRITVAQMLEWRIREMLNVKEEKAPCTSQSGQI